MPFVPVNCSAIPENLLEAEFFGYRKGAFTGANDDREGFFQAANGGTLFLDEIGDLPLSMQSKLLRSIQERSVRPVGAVTEVPVDVRLLSATHKDLGAEVQAGQFRQDLYYRLNVIQIRVPPLRERLEDLMGISERVLERLARDAGVWPAPRLTRDALVHLSRYPFPGQRARAREPAPPRGRAVGRRGARRLRPRPAGVGLHRQRGAGARPDRERGRVGDRGRARPGRGWRRSRSPCRTTSRSTSTTSSATSWFARSSTIASIAPRPGISLGLSLRQMRYRMARLNVNVGGDAGNADRE